MTITPMSPQFTSHVTIWPMILMTIDDYDVFMGCVNQQSSLVIPGSINRGELEHPPCVKAVWQHLKIADVPV